MEFKLTIDFSDRAVQALAAIAEALSISCVKPAQAEIAQNAPETCLNVEPAPVQADVENVHAAAAQPQSEAVSPEPDEPAETPKTELVKKSKKKTVKKAPESPQNAPEVEPAPVQAEVENVHAAAAQAQDEAVSPGPAEAQEAEKAEDDPMRGMSVMRAMQVLLDEIDEKGIDMADVNARIRAKAQELNLSYPSGTILMKAVGYVETRKIALGL